MLKCINCQMCSGMHRKLDSFHLINFFGRRGTSSQEQLQSSSQGLSLSVTILIPSLFNKCNTKGKLNAAVKAYGRRRKTLFLDMFYAKMLKKDLRFECMKNFDGCKEECYVHRVSGVFRVHGPIAGGDFKLLDAFFESSEQ